MSKIRNHEGFICFNEVGHNRFLVEFQKVVDIERVLKGQPWSFDKNLICIKAFDNNTSPSEMDFFQEPFWIQLFGLPLAAMTVEGGERIRSSIREVLDVDVDGDGLGWGKYLRILVIMDTTKPLPWGKLIRVEGIQRWIDFKYERLPLF